MERDNPSAISGHSDHLLFKKIAWRLIPFLIVCYFFAYLDRVNVGFAALTMNKALGLSALDYSMGAGIFFIGYFFFEVPSNIALEKFGARRWIARIMATWGILSVGMAFVTGATSFNIVRFFLGAAEAGFFPGIILFLTYWFPAVYRGRIVSLFMVAIPISTVIGAPVSGALLGLDGVAGLMGWQWLFIIEGLPAVILAVVTWWYLTDRPAEAAWLSEAERKRATALVMADQPTEVLKTTRLKALFDPRVLAMSVVYFGIVSSNYALGFWLPQIVKSFGFSNLQTGFISALPFLAGAVAMLFWSARSDATGERKWHVVLPLALAVFGLVSASQGADPVTTMAFLCLAGVGIFSAMPVFWATATSILPIAAAAGGIAMINSIANLAGFGGPYLVGWIKQGSDSFSAPLLALSIFPAVAILVLLFSEVRPVETRKIAEAS